MRKYKKLLVLTMSASMLAASLTGCGASAPAADSASSAPAAAAASSAPAADASAETAASSAAATADKAQTADDGRVHITYSQWGNDTETEACQKVADKFNSEQDKITVEVTKIDHDNYVTKLNTMATAGELPDTGIMSEAGVLNFAQNGLLADISDMYADSKEKPLDSLTFKFQGTPVAYSAANEVLNLWYNEDLLKQVCDKQGLDIADFTPPAEADKAWDWDTFVKVACTLTLDTSGRNALDPAFDPNNIDIYGCNVNTLPWQMEVWALSNGGGYYNADGTECTINSKETTDAIQKVADLVLKYHCMPAVSSASTALSTSLGTEKVVMATDGAWNVGTYLGPDAKFKYSVGVLPYMKDKVTICTGGPNVVFSQTKHPAEAMEWLKWYYQEENSWSLIEAGTWMPILDSWYTDKTKTDKWINNPNFPPAAQYKPAVVDYAMNNSKSTAWYYVNGTEEFNTTLDEALSYIWTGDMTAQEAMDKYYDELNGIFTSNNG